MPRPPVILPAAVLAAAALFAWPSVGRGQVELSEAHVRAMYKEFLRRNPKDSELKHWSGRGHGHRRHCDLYGAFLSSDEFYNNIAGKNEGRFIRILFDKMVGRPPEGREFYEWLRRFKNFGEHHDVSTRRKLIVAMAEAYNVRGLPCFHDHDHDGHGHHHDGPPRRPDSPRRPPGGGSWLPDWRDDHDHGGVASTERLVSLSRSLVGYARREFAGAPGDEIVTLYSRRVSVAAESYALALRRGRAERSELEREYEQLSAAISRMEELLRRARRQAPQTQRTLAEVAAVSKALAPRRGRPPIGLPERDEHRDIAELNRAAGDFLNRLRAYRERSRDYADLYRNANDFAEEVERLYRQARRGDSRQELKTQFYAVGREANRVSRGIRIAPASLRRDWLSVVTQASEVGKRLGAIGGSSSNRPGDRPGPGRGGRQFAAGKAAELAAQAEAYGQRLLQNLFRDGRVLRLYGRLQSLRAAATGLQQSLSGPSFRGDSRALAQVEETWSQVEREYRDLVRREPQYRWPLYERAEELVALLRRTVN